MHNPIVQRLAFLLSCFFIINNSNAQTNKYAAIDALLEKSTMIDATTALNKLKTEFQKDTTDAEYWLRYAKAVDRLNELGQALQAIDKAIALNPKLPAVQFFKGFILNASGKPNEAIPFLNRAIELKPEAEYFYWRGIMHHQLGNGVAAVNDYKQSIQGGFETAELYNNYAILLTTEEKFTEALQAINKAIALNQYYAQAFAARSKIHIYLGNIDSACRDKRQTYLMGNRNYVDIPDAICKGTAVQKINYTADVSAATTLYKRAVAAYTTAIEMGATTWANYVNRGYSYYKTGDFVNAEKDYKMALAKTDVGNVDLLYDNLSVLYYDMDEYVKSMAWSSKRIELNPSNHVPYIDRGLCYRKLGKFKEAEKDYNKSLELKPDFHRAFGYRSYLYLQLKQYQKSYDDALRSVEIKPDYGYGYLVLGQAKKILGMSDYCVDLLKAQQLKQPDADEAVKLYCK